LRLRQQSSLACGTVGGNCRLLTRVWVSAEFLIWAPVGICHGRVGDGGICSLDTVTCPKKNATRDHGIEPAPAASQPTP